MGGIYQPVLMESDQETAANKFEGGKLVVWVWAKNADNTDAAFGSGSITVQYRPQELVGADDWQDLKKRDGTALSLTAVGHEYSEAPPGQLRLRLNGATSPKVTTQVIKASGRPD